MKNNKLVFQLALVLFLLFSIRAQAQQHVCGSAEPSQAQINYLVQNVFNQPVYKNGGTTCIPIQLHIVRETNGTGGVSLAEIHEGIAEVNEYYKNAGLEFYFCGTGPNYVDNSTYYDFQSSEEDALALAAGENNNAINIYFVDGINYTGGPSFTAGYAYTPFNNVKSTRIIMRNGSVASGNTLVHEMGHHFSLLHTFRGTIDGPTDPDAEHVTRLAPNANCTTDGDFLCDTPADPGYSGATFSNCAYTGTATDIFGDLYVPDIANVMSYFPDNCSNPTILSPEQYTRIQQGHTTRQGHTAYDMSCPTTAVSDPSNLVVTLSGSSAVLNWTDNSNNEMGFFIERSTTSATAGFEAQGGFGVGPNTTTFTDNNTAAGTTYYYRVKASNDGCNDYSNVDSVSVQHCPAGSNTCDEYIERVQLNTLDNNNTPCSPGGYHDYTNLSTQLIHNVTYVLNITNGNSSFGDQCGAWIDWNQDDDFYDAGESLTVTGGSTNFTSTFTVPAGALIGNTKMRVRIHWTNEATDPCGTTVYGEVEDYTVNISSGAACSITAITSGTQSACDPNNNTYSQDVTISYVNAPGGTIDVNGQTFASTTSPQTVTLTGLTADGNNVNVTAFFTNETACTFTQNNAFTAPANCTPSPCNITAITAGTQSACDPNNNTYTQDVVITYVNPPSGTIQVNGQTFAITGSPQTVTLLGLTANGNGVNVTASFTNQTSCNITANNVFTAPANCSPTPCSITAITAGTQSACDPNNNTYTQDVTITYANAPGGTINLNGQTFAITTSPQTVTLTALTADGNSVNVVAFFTNQTACNFTANNLFTAPANCTPAPCSITAISAGTQSACDPNNNTYTQDVTITYANAPGGTIDVNGQTFALTTSPQTVTLVGLTANGSSVNVTAFFTNQTACNFTANNVFTAPANCTPAGCNITSITAGVQGPCDSATNTYTQEVIVNYSNPSSASILINGQTFNVTTSPQTFTLTGLTADGNPVDVTADFISGSICTLTVNNVFTAPVSCQSTCIVGDVNATLDGDTFDYCPGTVVNLLTDSNEVVPTGEAYIWVFINATDTVFVNTGGSYSGDVNAALVAGGGTAIPFGTYLVYGLLTESAGTVICDVTPGDFYVNVLDSANAVCLSIPPCSAGDVAANLDGTTVDYCPGTTINLNTDGTENVLANEDYLWVFMSATDTIFLNVGASYSGDINADLVAAGGTAMPAGVYTVFGLTTESGGALVCDVTPGDFIINILDSNDPACLNPCAINAIGTGIQSPCDPASNTYSQELLITYTNEPGGTLNVNGQTFPITGSPQSIILGGLPADGNPVTAFAFFTNSTSCNYTENNLFNAPTPCSPICDIVDVVSGTQSACDPNTNTFSQDVTITYTNAPTGTINVNGQIFPITTSPQTVTLTNLPANGASVPLFVFFTNTTTCNFNANIGFISPISCAPMGANDSLVVMMYPNGAGTLFVGNDVITNTPFTGYYPSNALLDISAVPGANDVFNYWRLNNQSLIDFSPMSDFLFNGQDTLFAYFNGSVSINDLQGEFEDFKVYPTLVEDQIIIEFTAIQETDLRIELFSLDGKLVSTLLNNSFQANQVFKQSYSLNLASGMYFIKGSTREDSFSTRIIVE